MGTVGSSPRRLLSDEWTGSFYGVETPGQRAESRPRRDGAGGIWWHHTAQNGAQFEAYGLFISGIFI